ncbi:MAG TPA: thiamine pyrophosphate-binding protein [Polyangiaceae bacterium]|jgi:acetolactate synthase-1/2/3 large subunit
MPNKVVSPGKVKKESGEHALTSAVHAVAQPRATRVVDVFVRLLEGLGVTHAFGCTGGTIALFCEALAQSNVQVAQCRHESGAAFAAAEAFFATGHVTVVFTTSGPSILNALNGLMAARTEGAKVILVSGSTPPRQRGRGAFQETSTRTLPRSVFTKGSIFDYAIDLVDPEDLDEAARALEEGLAGKSGFVAHVALPSSVQGHPFEPRAAVAGSHSRTTLRGEDAAALAATLRSEPFGIWVGFGAREDADLVRAFAERAGAPVIASPRGRGIMPENHPLFVGVTGLASPSDCGHAVAARRLKRMVVLGSRLGEFTSLWDERLVPEGGIVQVDVDAEVPRAFPQRPRLLIRAEIRDFLTAMLEHWGSPVAAAPHLASTFGETPPASCRPGPVRPQLLMATLQRVVVEAGARLLVDCGNCFAWANTHLRFNAPRYRVSLGWGSMGQATAGVIGAAMTSTDRCVALVGDGAMLMQNELSTAVKYGVPAVWVVLNDAQYGMIEQGMRAGHLEPVETQIPRVDFVALAESVGARGISVREEREVDAALRAAMSATGPFVVDVHISRDELAPIRSRVAALETQGVGKIDE